LPARRLNRRRAHVFNVAFRASCRPKAKIPLNRTSDIEKIPDFVVQMRVLFYLRWLNFCTQKAGDSIRRGDRRGHLEPRALYELASSSAGVQDKVKRRIAAGEIDNVGTAGPFVGL
jgi:hypothetical protein